MWARVLETTDCYGQNYYFCNFLTEIFLEYYGFFQAIFFEEVKVVCTSKIVIFSQAFQQNATCTL